MERKLRDKSISSQTVSRYVLDAVAIPFLEELEEGIEGTIFIEEHAKVHLRTKQKRRE